ncbi:hypothetical protein EV177_008755 [Coemansia sp. RSA 1804]|nr:hypothetical protein EV177_008755 [Coemansia sp. RSA 1804]
MLPSRSRPRPRLAAALLVPLLAAVLLGIASSPARRAPLSSEASALAAPPLVSVWANRRNPLNSYFAKFAWAWTSVLFAAAFAASTRSRPAAASALHAVRYALATLYWVAAVRWFFGPPLLDRLFVATGGECSLASTPAPLASQSACRSAGGLWAGGHDVSGHCFLLLHSALFLAEEVLVPLRAPPTAPLSRSAAIVRYAIAAAAAALVCVWGFLLFFTAKYFHGASEVLSGSLAGVAFWAPLYCLGSGGVFA